MTWLHPLLQATEAGLRVLVLARSSATAVAVKRALALRGGSLGVEVLTPDGLARALAGGVSFRAAADEDPVVPDAHPWSSLAERPGLRRLLEEHLADMRLTGLTAEQIPALARPWLTAGWGLDAGTRALLALCDAAAARAAKLDDEHTYERVFAIGFGGANDLPVRPGRTAYHERLLASLAAIPLAGPAGPEVEAITATRVADVVAEARWVAARAAAWTAEGRAPDEILVLTACREDSNRVRAALARSGLAAADDEGRAFSEHALVALIERLRPWFDPDDPQPQIEAADLRRVLANPLIRTGMDLVKDERAIWDTLGQDSDRSANDKESDEGVDVEQDVRLSRRALPRVLAACRLVRAPIAAWLVALEQVVGHPGEPAWVRRAALLVKIRLAWLAAHHGSTLGHLRAFLDQLGVIAWHDSLARAIQAALRDARDEPATQEALDETLSGAAASGVVHRGVVVLPAVAYDGRPAGLLLLTGLHSKGLGAAPAPDPFFTVDQLAAWGRLGGARHVVFLRQQVLAAARRAGRVEAAVAERDATGRALAPLVGLPLVYEGAPIGSYALLSPAVPEVGNLRALERVDAPPPATDEAGCGDEDADAAAHAASAEWVRAGSGLEAPPPEPPVAGDESRVPPDPTLRGVLARVEALVPPPLAPWLGAAHAEPAAHLPADTTISATGGAKALTHCLYQAFLKLRLRLKEPEKVEEDLDAREIGTAVHEAMEGLGIDPRWRPKDEDRAAAISSLQADVRQALAERMRHKAGELPTPSAAVGIGRDSVEARWAKHLESYVAGRVEAIETAAKRARAAAVKAAWSARGDDDGVIAEQVAEMISLDMSVQAHRTAVRPWLRFVIAHPAHRASPASDAAFDAFRAEGGKASGNVQQAIATGYHGQRKDIDPLLQVLYARFDQRFRFEAARAGEIRGGATEWPFGRSERDPEAPPFVMDLGPAAGVHLVGSIDRVRASEAQGEVALEIADYKTGSALQAKDFLEGLEAGTLPQLLLYGLALREAIRRSAQGDLPTTEHPFVLAYDFVRKVAPKDGFLDVVEGEEGLAPAAFAELLGDLIERARAGDWPLAPHDLACPRLKDYGHDWCPYPDVCRFRAWPGAEEAGGGDDALDDSSDEGGAA